MATLEVTRAEELLAVKGFFPASADVLELGGGSGYQALLLSQMGLQVKSIDVSAAAGTQKFFPVDIYDGSHIPYENSTFDVVYSSNVLEHVKELNAMMAEVHRVLKPGGVAIHILPTPTWRFWTSVAHYGYLIVRAFGSSKSVEGGTAPSLQEKIDRGGILATLKRILWAGPHGEYPSAASELWYFSRRRWQGVFEMAGYRIEHMAPAGLFYTGYALAPFIGMRARKSIAKVLGSSTYIYVLRKP